MAELGGQICVNQTPRRVHISTEKTAQARPSNGEALVEQQHEDHDKDATKSDDTDLFGLTFYLTWRGGQWAVSHSRTLN